MWESIALAASPSESFEQSMFKPRSDDTEGYSITVGSI